MSTITNKQLRSQHGSGAGRVPRKIARAGRLRQLVVAGLVAGGALALPACRVLETRQAPSGDGGLVSGNYYYLPKGIVTVEGVPKVEEVNDQPVTTFAITTSLSLEPDARARYFLEHKKSLLFDDTVEIGVGSDGLLSAVNTIAEDKSPTIIADLTDSFINAVKLVSSGTVPKIDRVAAEPFKVSFDPFDRGEINRIHDMLATIGIELVVSEVPEQLVRVSVPAGDQPVGGVLFRPGVPFDITVTWASAAKVANRTLVFVPDPQSTIAFEASRKAFVKKSTDLTFTNGMLTKSKVVMPSQLAGVAAIPKGILAAVVPLPQALRDDTKKALETQAAIDKLQAPPTELDLIKARIDLLDARQRLQDLENPD